jgi:hypothetical protein
MRLDRQPLTSIFLRKRDELVNPRRPRRGNTQRGIFHGHFWFENSWLQNRAILRYALAYIAANPEKLNDGSARTMSDIETPRSGAR